MLAETPFYYRLSQLKSRVGESVVQSPGYTPCCTGQRAAAVDLLHLRLAKVELTVSPQKSARRCVTRIDEGTNPLSSLLVTLFEVVKQFL